MMNTMNRKNERKVTGIIAEYNPFHNGHLYHLQQAKERGEADFVVAVMSGNFTQRGEPAVLDKWERSRLAIACGIDLVLELPFFHACSSAEFFAKGAVTLLSGLGCVTHLAFGAEEQELSVLQEIAETAAEENAQWKAAIRDSMASGVSYGKARELALEKVLGSGYGQAVKSPNNILAVEYLKQLIDQSGRDSNLNLGEDRPGQRGQARQRKLDGQDRRSFPHLHMEPVLIPRKGTGYYDRGICGNFASATAIRSSLSREERVRCVPPPVAEALESQLSAPGFFDSVRTKILSMDSGELAEILSVTEGLEHKLKKEIRTAVSLDGYVQSLVSRRYPENRIRRLLCHILMGVKKKDSMQIMAADALYARVLAFNQSGAQLLKQIKKEECASVPVITNINHFLRGSRPQNRMLELDLRATDLFNLINGRDLYAFSDYVIQPRMVESGDTVRK